MDQTPPSDEPLTECWLTSIDQSQVDIYNFTQADVSINHIATVLSRRCRWGGITPRFYSVAQHSVAVSRRLQRGGWSFTTQLKGLIHDGGESYLSDIQRPLKADPRMRWYVELEHKILHQIALHEGIGEVMTKLVVEADDEELHIERQWFKTGAARTNYFQPLNPEGAKRLWFERYWELRGKRATGVCI